MRQTAARTGVQILVAAVATAAGFLGFVPTDSRGVAELGLIAGVGMLIAFVCTLTFLPAVITLFRPRGERAEVGFRWRRRSTGDRPAPTADPGRVRRAGGVGARLSPRLEFDSDPLHTKNPDTEAMRTLHDLMDNR